MGGFPATLVGYELSSDAFNHYQLNHGLAPGLPTIKALLQDIQSQVQSPISFARYDDNKERTHMLVCCFADLSGRSYSIEEFDAIPVPSAFSRICGQEKIDGKIRRIFASTAMVYSYSSDGKTRVNVNAVIGASA